jgi:hypothetical protein
MSRVQRAESILRSKLDAIGVSQDAQIAIENSIDPFPDTRRPLRGWPDGKMGYSVCPKSKQSMTITCPPALITAGTPWDLHIFHNPVSGPQLGGFGFGTVQNNTAGQPLNALQIGSPFSSSFSGVCAVALASGTAFQMSSFSPSTSATLTQLLTPAAYLTDLTRMTASAIEVHNPSSNLKKQGSITVWRQASNSPQYASSYLTTQQISGQQQVTGTVSGLPVPQPPGTTASALQLPDSEQWNAEAGAYLVGKLHTMDIPVNAQSFVQPLYYLNSASTDNGFAMLPPNPLAQSGTPPAGPVVGFHPQFWNEYDGYGCILTGLDPSNTILINWNAGYEQSPTGGNTLIQNLATTASALDIRGLEALSTLHYSLPVGVTVDRNLFGDWISGVASTISKNVGPTLDSLRKIAPALAMIPHPAARAAGIGLMATGSNAQQRESIQQMQNANSLTQAVNRLNGVSSRARQPRAPRNSVRFAQPTQASASRNRQRIARGNRGQLTPSGGPAGSTTS